MDTTIGHPFEVQAIRGQLPGKPGDFLLTNFSARETASPTDVWIVDQSLFRKTQEVLLIGQ